nr:MAG TPA: hypothetical protein [Caudoviricetes sp.]
MFTFGVVVSAIAFAPIAVILAAIVVAVMTFNFVVRELMLAAWDLSVQAISDIEGFVKALVSEKTSVVKEVTSK